MHVSLSDRDLIRAYRSGDERAFATLLNRHQSSVFTKIHFIVRDHEIANDLFQDTWIRSSLRKFILQLEVFQTDESPRPCLPKAGQGQVDHNIRWG